MIPVRTAEVLVQVNVRRDQYLPEFEGDYNTTINVNRAVNNVPLFTVKANDRDRVVSNGDEVQTYTYLRISLQSVMLVSVG